MLFVAPVLFLQQGIKKVCCGKTPLLPVIKTQSIFTHKIQECDANKIENLIELKLQF